MPIVECIACKGTGKSKYASPARQNRRLVYIANQCEVCQGQGKLRIKTPSAEWRKLADEAQALARKALGR